MKEIKVKDFETVIKAFDMTIQHAIESQESILFDCIEIPTVITEERWHGCPSYCPLYHDGVYDECDIERSAEEWLNKKKEFIDSVKIKGIARKEVKYETN